MQQSSHTKTLIAILIPKKNPVFRYCATTLGGPTTTSASRALMSRQVYQTDESGGDGASRHIFLRSTSRDLASASALPLERLPIYHHHSFYVMPLKFAVYSGPARSNSSSLSFALKLPLPSTLPYLRPGERSSDDQGHPRGTLLMPPL